MTNSETTMRRWMIAVGIFYLVLGLRLLPFVNGPMIEAVGVDAVYRGGDLAPGMAGYEFVLDWMGTFGMSLVPLGAVLLVASRAPQRNRLLVHLVIWHEILAGVLADAWYIGRGHVSTGFYLGFIAVHALVIATGARALRRAPADASQPVVEGTAPRRTAALGGNA